MPRYKKKDALEIVKKIKHCIGNNGVLPYYQPIIDNKTKEVHKYEALMRLDYKSDIIFPSDFMDLSLKSKTYKALSIKQIFGDVDNHNIHVSINLNNDNITNKETVGIIHKLLSNCKYPGNVTFEIIETFEIKNFDIINRFIADVKKYGAKISIDDFGTGYSNFEYFSKLDFDYLKIDGSFVKDIAFNTKHQNIVNSLVLLVKGTKIKLIGEFVENKHILQKLIDLGVHFSQGYYFGKPQPLDALLNSEKKELLELCN